MERNYQIVILSPVDILKGRVESILQVNTAAAYANLGFDVTLIAPYHYRKNNISTDGIRDHYNVHTNFKVVTLPTILSDFLSHKLWMRLNFIFTFLPCIFSIFRRTDNLIFHSKGVLPMQLILWVKRLYSKNVKTVFETHLFDGSARTLKVLERVDRILVNSKATENALTRAGISPSKIITEYNPPFARPQRLEQAKAKRELGFNSDEFSLVYTGKLFDQILEFLVDIPKYSNIRNVKVHVVGGNPTYLRRANKLLKARKENRVIFHGFVAPSQIGLYLSAADFLISDYYEGWPYIEQCTPAKYFDYALSRRPIICSENSAITELFKHETNCIYFKPGDVRDFCNKLEAYREKTSLLNEMGENNAKLVEKFSWDKRVQRIVQSLDLWETDSADVRNIRNCK